MTPAKAITVCQPYPHLIAIGDKVIENRTWFTSYRGPLYIHAGKSRDWLDPGDLERYPEMVFGAIVARVRLVGCVRLEQLTEPWKSHPHAHGPWCWLLADVVRLAQPIPCRGAQGLWKVAL